MSICNECCILCKHCHKYEFSKSFIRLECDEDHMPNAGVFDPYSTAENCPYYERENALEREKEKHNDN